MLNGKFPCLKHLLFRKLHDESSIQKAFGNAADVAHVSGEAFTLVAVGQVAVGVTGLLHQALLAQERVVKVAEVFETCQKIQT